MPNIGLIRAFLEQATAQGSRSTALNPLGWLIAMLLPATLASYYFDLPPGISLTLGILMVIAVVAYVVAYFYFMKHTPDALRSERYSLKRFAMERGIYGDSITGSVDLADIVETKQISARDMVEDEEMKQ